MTSDHFPGFSPESFVFLSELEANNSKDWFDANRDRYEAHWKAPAVALTNALVDQMAALSPPLKAEARINGTLRRINRDVRFSRDKTPYNPRLHMIFWSGSHPNRSPAFHLVLSAQGIGYGAGVFGVEPAALAQYRARITDPAQRRALLAAIDQAAAVGCEFDKPDLVKLPRGFTADPDWGHLLRRKAFVMRTLQDVAVPDWISNADAVPRIMVLATALSPLNAWLAEP